MHQPDTAPAHHAAASRTVVTRNADELARNLTDWEQSYDQMTAGSFRGLLTQWRTPAVQIFREEISQSVRQSCTLWDGALWFGFPDRGDGTRINGRPAEADCVLVRPGGSEFELLTPSAHAIYGMVVERETLARAALLGGLCIDWDHLASAELLRVDPWARRACVGAIAAALSTHAELPQALEPVLVARLLGLLGNSGVAPAPAHSLQRRQKIVARVRELVLARRDQTLTVPELCALTHVSRRTLQYCFEDVLGMSPVAYLRRVRLNGARRQLLDPRAGQQSIGAVAMDWGFGSCSQFSCDYRSLFGETPSVSLNRLHG